MRRESFYTWVCWHISYDLLKLYVYSTLHMNIPDPVDPLRRSASQEALCRPGPAAWQLEAWRRVRASRAAREARAKLVLPSLQRRGLNKQRTTFFGACPALHIVSLFVVTSPPQRRASRLPPPRAVGAAPLGSTRSVRRPPRTPPPPARASRSRSRPGQVKARAERQADGGAEGWG